MCLTFEDIITAITVTVMLNSSFSSDSVLGVHGQPIYLRASVNDGTKYAVPSVYDLLLLTLRPAVNRYNIQVL